MPSGSARRRRAPATATWPPVGRGLLAQRTPLVGGQVRDAGVMSPSGCSESLPCTIPARQGRVGEGGDGRGHGGIVGVPLAAAGPPPAFREKIAKGAGADVAI